MANFNIAIKSEVEYGLLMSILKLDLTSKCQLGTVGMVCCKIIWPFCNCADGKPSIFR